MPFSFAIWPFTKFDSVVFFATKFMAHGEWAKFIVNATSIPFHRLNVRSHHNVQSRHHNGNSFKIRINFVVSIMIPVLINHFNKGLHSIWIITRVSFKLWNKFGVRFRLHLHLCVFEFKRSMTVIKRFR